MTPIVKILKVGKIDYLSGLKVQKHLTDLHFETSDVANTLLFVEHPPVFTTGIRTKEYNKDDEKRLKETGAEFYRTNRGGLITFHGPGQLVIYPILNLKHFKPSMRWYICHIEKTIINLCRSLGLDAKTSAQTGVWIGDNKVCAIGVHGSRFVTSHGLAMNCCTDLQWYKHIDPCGIKDKGVTSLSKELNKHVSINDTIPWFLESFKEVFNCSYADFDNTELKHVLPLC